MPLEQSDTIAGLNPAWPTGADPKSQGDDHIRLVKDVLQKDALTKSFVQEYHDPAGVASWRIVGSTLECWGTEPTSGGVAAVTMPKGFTSVPTLQTSVRNDAGFSWNDMFPTHQFFGPNAVNVIVRNAAGALVDYPIAWHAIGEWDGVL